jgi:glutathione S-transferase
VNPLTKSQISFSKDHKKVPLVTFGESNPMGESGEIIEYITKNVADSGKLNKSKFFSEDSDKWTEWSEKKLAVFLYPNITRSYEESWECFEYSADVPEWNLPERLVTRPVGSFFMSLANGKIKKKYNIVDERKELKECISEWTDAVGDKKFLHGEFVTMPDIMVYGVLRAIAGFTTFRELMAEDVKLKTWYDNVQAAVTK